MLMIKRPVAYSVTCILLSATLLFTVFSGLAARRTVRSSSTAYASPFILIDAGHGGADGGTVGCDGTQEKHLNLAIALPLADMLAVCGYSVATTRTDDVSIHTQGSSLREQKVSDLKNRLSLLNRSLITVSIHQNQFPVAKYNGTQVFFAPYGDSDRLAECIREQVVALLQPDNTRQCKQGSSDIYLLSNAQRPAVIVECGFLSNPQECALLGTQDYQQQMAFSVLAGVLQYDP